MADQLTEDQIAELKEAFVLYDMEGDGTIAAKHVGTVMRSLGQNPRESEVENLIIRAGSSTDGNVSFKQFLLMMGQRYLDVPDSQAEKASVINSFRNYDKACTGMMSVAELRHITTKYGSTGMNVVGRSGGEALTVKEFDDMLRESGIPADGQINYVDFVEMMSK